MQHIHFIAIGGAAMHNLAIELKRKGFNVTGSDDEIFEPSLSRLRLHGLLPQSFGWFPEHIDKNIDTVILGMHARPDNPELLKALDLGIEVVSYPEFLYNRTKDKKRVVIAGSHGKTTTTAMILHVLKQNKMSFDFMVGSQIEGFDLMVGLSEQSDVAIFEGDEYLSSPIDRRSKFHWYKPHIAVITGIEWDHVNVFPTFEMYVNTFGEFIANMPSDGRLFWYENDNELTYLIGRAGQAVNTVPYSGLKWHKSDGKSLVCYGDNEYQSNLFGDHNFQNMHAALLVCLQLGIESANFFDAMSSFKGASRRLQQIKDAEKPVFFDFAHAPSKVRATANAVRQMYSDRKIVACYELHTFSSLSKSFIPNYKDTLNNVDKVIVYYNTNVLEHKGITSLEPSFVANCFRHSNIEVVTDNIKLFDNLSDEWRSGAAILLMSSGNFGGFDVAKWAQALV